MPSSLTQCGSCARGKTVVFRIPPQLAHFSTHASRQRYRLRHLSSAGRQTSVALLSKFPTAPAARHICDTYLQHTQAHLSQFFRNCRTAVAMRHGVRHLSSAGRQTSVASLGKCLTSSAVRRICDTYLQDIFRTLGRLAHCCSGAIPTATVMFRCLTDVCRTPR